MSKTVAVVGTLDTKGDELRFVADLIRKARLDAIIIDVGIMGSPRPAGDITRAQVAKAAGSSVKRLQASGDRGKSVETMATGVAVIVKKIHAQGKIHGIVSLGGSAGATIGTTAMRSLPVGVPKLMVTTVASGDTRPYVGAKDITMMHSVVDIAGLNRISREILANAAGAIIGMVKTSPPKAKEDRPIVVASMFGVTTPCVTHAMKLLEQQGYEVLVFHATGSGGQAMEELVHGGFVTGVLDVTTTELADELVGGVLSAGPQRLEAAGAAGVPQVVAPGALDMVNFGPPDTVPRQFKTRHFYQHNPTVTLMRTTTAENAKLGTLIGKKLSAAVGPSAFFYPKKGVSAIDADGGVFEDNEADAAFLKNLRKNLSGDVPLFEFDNHINDLEFAEAMTNKLMEMMEAS
jgi:uncharacterized protein (UPF0261 family)